jgi:hypothetical protein
VAADLHMEQSVRGALGYQFSNLQSESILRTGKICGVLNSICSVFEQSSVAKISTSHSSPRFESDLRRQSHTAIDELRCIHNQAWMIP